MEKSVSEFVDAERLFENIEDLASKVTSLVSSDVRLKGNMLIKKGIKIDGEVLGDIVSDDSVAHEPCVIIVGATGYIDGNVVGEVVIVYGAVNGSVKATQHLELANGSSITGDIQYKNLKMHDGAVIDGAIRHIEKTISAERMPEIRERDAGDNIYSYPILNQAVG